MEYRRFYKTGARYFFTVVTAKRKPLLVEHIDCLKNAFRLCLKRHPFEIEAIVVLPDHLHTLWKLPEGDDDFSKRWMVIKRNFSTGFINLNPGTSQIKKREKGIWQRRFWEHYIRDERDWINHFNYIHFNPVKHGYVESPEDWPHGSYKKAVERGFYDLRSLDGELISEIPGEDYF